MDFFKYVANKSNILLLRNGVYTIGDMAEYSEAKDRLEARTSENDIFFPLNPVDFDSFWELYRTGNSGQIEDRISKETENLVKKYSGTADTMAKNLYNLDEKYAKILRGIIFETGKFFLERSGNEMEKFSDNKVPEYEEILKILESRLGKASYDFSSLQKAVMSKITVEDLPEFRDFALKTIADEHNFEKEYDGYLLLGGSTVGLARSRGLAGRREAQLGDMRLLRVVVDGTSYNLEKSTFASPADIMDETVKRYLDLTVENEAKKSIISKGGVTDPIVEKEVSIIGAVVETGKNQKDVDLGNWGINLESSDCIVVYLKVPPYALRDWMDGDHGDSKYYAFPGCKVGVDVYKGQDLSNPYFYGPAESPFKQGRRDNNKSNLCMDSWSSENPDIGKLPFFERAAKYLMDAKKVVLMGYTPHGHGGVTKTLRKFDRVSREDLKRRDIPVTNE